MALWENVKTVHKNEAKLLCIYFIPLKRRERTSRIMYNLCECVTKQKINSNNCNRLLQKDLWIGTTTCSNACTADYVILSLECFASNLGILKFKTLSRYCLTSISSSILRWLSEMKEKRVKYILIMFQIVSWTKTQNLMYIILNLYGTDCC